MATRSLWLRFGLAGLAVAAALLGTAGLLSAAAAGPRAGAGSTAPQLPAGSTLTGRVTDAQTGQPVSGSLVVAYEALSRVALANDLSNAQGFYSLTVATVYGSVKLRFDSGLPYGLTWYGDEVDFGHAATIPVALNTTVPGLNMALTRAGHLSATVTVAGVAPAAGSTLLAQLYATDGTLVAQSQVVSGQTRMDLRPSTYRLRFVGNSAAPDWYTAAPVAIAAGLTTSLPIDLGRGAVITGRITDALSGLPLANANVALFDALGQYLVYPSSYAVVDANGVYTAGGLATGRYRLSFRAADHQAQDYAGGAAISLTAGLVRGGLDASLSPLAIVSGQLTRNGGQPLGLLDSVQLRAFFESSPIEAGRADLFGPLPGGYRLAVQPGRVQLRASGTGLAPEWYDNQTIQPVAKPLSVIAGQTLANVDIDLALGSGCLTGAITGPGGPLGGAWVQVFDGNGQPLPQASTQADGTYRVCGLANGLYRLLFGQYPYPLLWNGGQPEQGLARPIAVMNGMTTTVDAQLAGLGGCIDASLIGPDGLTEPANHRRVYLLDAHGGRQWFYETTSLQPIDTFVPIVDGRLALCGLPAASYSLVGYEDGNFDNQLGPAELAGRQGVTVAAGQGMSVSLRLLPAALYLPLVWR